MVKPIVYGAIGGGAAVVIAVVVLFAFQPTTQYALSVEPRTEMVMGVGNTIRVYIQNTGSSPLTNVKINYGTTSEPVLPVLSPGEKQMFSPPAGTKMIIVTDDQNITVTKPISETM